MNPNEKTNIYDLENKEINEIDFGNDELNDFYKNLPENIKIQVNKKALLQTRINILKDMKNPEINEIYDKLNQNTKQKLDNMNVYDKYTLLKKKITILKEKKNEQMKTVIHDVVPIEVKEKTVLNDNETPEELFNNQKEDNEREDTEREDTERENDERHEKREKGAKRQEKINKETSLNSFEKIVNTYYSLNPYIKTIPNRELEVRFGTKGVKRINKNDYDNVIKKLKSLGFTSIDENGEYSLRIQNEYLDNRSGLFKLSSVRTEIYGLNQIQTYCKTNDINEVRKLAFNSVNFTNKKQMYINNQKVYPVNFDDFNFRVSLQDEEEPKYALQNFITTNWKRSKKTFRYLNRVTFIHPDFPINVDISIVKYGNKGQDRFGNEGRGEMIRVYNIDESNVFNNQESYEIELEVNNSLIGPGTVFKTPEIILQSIRKVIKFILSGLQGTNFPISYPEQKNVLNSYMSIIMGEDYDINKRIENKNFIGPSSVTLQLVNISKIEENSNIINIRKDFTVTEKADGTRHLMYINNEGMIYLITTNMEVKFTGAKTLEKETFNTILDGELILHDKYGKFINLYAAFDIYYYKKQDVRAFTFMPSPLEKNKEKDFINSRFNLLKMVISGLKSVSILDQVKKEDPKSVKHVLHTFQKSQIISPIKIVSKEFYPLSSNETIFDACNRILTKVKEGLFEYETDGLIFTPAYFGVGSDKIGISGPKTKITWSQSFKWKPPKYNTIDFLVTTLKSVNGDDVVKPIFEDGINTNHNVQISEYKPIQLRCSFNKKNHGYINPCQDVIDDHLPEFKNKYDDTNENEIIPVQFYPTEPYDIDAGLCNIMLKKDENNVNQMFTEDNEVFTDNTIVEFSYNFDREKGWRWIPLRVRYDKTTEMLQGKKNFGNAYHVANDNWKSIHNPVTEEMISTGLNIPEISANEDIYYNETSGVFKTEAMKNFHNLFVKKLLIKSVSKKGDTLIDYACGKAGDLPKWINSQLSFVFGIDVHKDNLENKLDGACARYLNSRKRNKNMPYALFVNGNSSYNIKNGSAMLNDKAIQITKAIFGNGPKNEEVLGAGVARQYGKGDNGFNISSCQFALHYFLENPDTLQGFLRNISECTALDGYFIGTAYDGKLMFNLLKKQKYGESVQIVEDGKKVWEVTKMYYSESFDDNSSSIGYKIDVYQDSINKTFSEYLINFDYLERVLEMYGFKLISRDEAQSLGLPEGSGLFSELFLDMLDEIKKNKFKEKDYGKAINMTSYEKKISFLNRYFVFKKVRHVNAEKVELELNEYNEMDININKEDSKKAVSNAIEDVKRNKNKVRKLTKKLLLEPATEATDEIVAEKIDIENKDIKLNKEINEEIKNKKGKSKKLIIIEEDET